jgi:hypothetical protein
MKAGPYYELRELVSKYKDSLPQTLILELEDVFFQVHKVTVCRQNQSGVDWDWVWETISRLLQNYYKSLPTEIQEIYNRAQEQNTPLPWL